MTSQAYQTVELADGTWSVFSLVTGEQVGVVATKADAIRHVSMMNRHHNQVLDVIGSLLGRNGDTRATGTAGA